MEAYGLLCLLLLPLRSANRGFEDWMGEVLGIQGDQDSLEYIWLPKALSKVEIALLFDLYFMMILTISYVTSSKRVTFLIKE